MHKLNKKNEEYQKNLEKIQSSFLSHKELDKNLKSMALEYFEFCWRKKKIFQAELNQFNDLSRVLSRDCYLFTHQEILVNIPLFSNLQVSELYWIIQHLKTEVFMPNDFLQSKGEISKEMYFIIEGLVQEFAELVAEKPEEGKTKSQKQLENQENKSSSNLPDRVLDNKQTQDEEQKIAKLQNIIKHNQEKQNNQPYEFSSQSHKK